MAIPHPDGSYETRGESPQEIAAELARAIVDEHLHSKMAELPAHLAEVFEMVADIETATHSVDNGFTTVTFQTTYSFHLQAPVPVESVADVESLMPLACLGASSEAWSVRFFQSPRTSRYHVISSDPPQVPARPSTEPLWIENVNRQEFFVRTRGDEAEALGGLIFDHYMPLIDAALDLQRRIPVMIAEEASDFSLQLMAGSHDMDTGAYSLTFETDSGDWDCLDFPWTASPSEFAMALALATPGRTKWHFSVMKTSPSRWRIMSAPYLLNPAVGDRFRIETVEETESEHAVRMVRARLERQRERVAADAERHRMQNFLNRDAADRRLWLAQTDGLHLVRVILHRRDLGQEIGGPIMNATLESNPMRPWMDPHVSVNWMDAPVHGLREIGRIGTMRRFEFDVEAAPSRELIPMEMWASYYLDTITVERIEITSRPTATTPEMASLMLPIEPRVLYSSLRALRAAEEMNAAGSRADPEILARIAAAGDLRFRRSPDQPQEPRGPVPGNTPRTRSHLNDFRLAGSAGRCLGGGCSFGSPTAGGTVRGGILFQQTARHAVSADEQRSEVDRMRPEIPSSNRNDHGMRQDRDPESPAP